MPGNGGAETPIFCGPNDILLSYGYTGSIYTAVNKDRFTFYFVDWMYLQLCVDLMKAVSELEEIPARASWRKGDTVSPKDQVEDGHVETSLTV